MIHPPDLKKHNNSSYLKESMYFQTNNNLKGSLSLYLHMPQEVELDRDNLRQQKKRK
jgi:hypothetical protein